MTRIGKSFLHIIVGSVILIPFFFINEMYTGAIVVSTFYFSRERTQFQYKIKGSSSTLTVWYRGWIPFEWGMYSFFDWFIPTTYSLLVAFLIDVNVC